MLMEHSRHAGSARGDGRNRRGLLCGCTMVGPDFTEPPASLDRSWSAEARPVTAPGLAVGTTWWHSLDDLQLTRLIETAAAQNLSLQRAGARVLQSRAVLAAAVATTIRSSNRPSDC